MVITLSSFISILALAQAAPNLDAAKDVPPLYRAILVSDFAQATVEELPFHVTSRPASLRQRVNQGIESQESYSEALATFALSLQGSDPAALASAQALVDNSIAAVDADQGLLETTPSRLANLAHGTRILVETLSLLPEDHAHAAAAAELIGKLKRTRILDRGVALAFAKQRRLSTDDAEFAYLALAPQVRGFTAKPFDAELLTSLEFDLLVATASLHEPKDALEDLFSGMIQRALDPRMRLILAAALSRRVGEGHEFGQIWAAATGDSCAHQDLAHALFGRSAHDPAAWIGTWRRIEVQASMESGCDQLDELSDVFFIIWGDEGVNFLRDAVQPSTAMGSLRAVRKLLQAALETDQIHDDEAQRTAAATIIRTLDLDEPSDQDTLNALKSVADISIPGLDDRIMMHFLSESGRAKTMYASLLKRQPSIRNSAALIQAWHSSRDADTQSHLFDALVKQQSESTLWALLAKLDLVLSLEDAPEQLTDMVKAMGFRAVSPLLESINPPLATEEDRFLAMLLAKTGAPSVFSLMMDTIGADPLMRGVVADYLTALPETGASHVSAFVRRMPRHLAALTYAAKQKLQGNACSELSRALGRDPMALALVMPILDGDVCPDMQPRLLRQLNSAGRGPIGRFLLKNLDNDTALRTLSQDQASRASLPFPQWPPYLLSASSGVDTDADGIVDGTERLWGLDPENEDSDGDGMVDGLDRAPNMANDGALDDSTRMMWRILNHFYGYQQLDGPLLVELPEGMGDIPNGFLGAHLIRAESLDAVHELMALNTGPTGITTLAITGYAVDEESQQAIVRVERRRGQFAADAHRLHFSMTSDGLWVLEQVAELWSVGMPVETSQP